MRRLALLALSFVAALGAGACATAPRQPHTFTIGGADFLLDGERLLLRCGEMHAVRIPPEYWRHRLRMVKAMGCNTVCAYMFWNQHEARQGEFDFTGAADVARYCRIAQEEGLFVILRPGPYSCAEFEFAGFPWWLLQIEDIQVRTQDPRYLAAMRRYLLRVGEELQDLQITRGGPILMVQVENEYGSYGKDKDYIGLVRDCLVDAGFEVPLFTCDGPSQLPNDTRDDIFCVVNFGSQPEANFAALRQVRPTGPLMCGEYYPGWFDSWGKPHHRGDAEKIVQDLSWMLEHNASFSIYMVHGGTSFGFTAGANSPPFSPQSTSYDYDAPIDEAGHATPKYHAIRELFARHLLPGEALPDVPPPPLPVVALPAAEFTAVAPLLTQPLPWLPSDRPLTFEQLGQATGLVRYRCALPGGLAASTLRIDQPHDYAQVYVDGERRGILDRRHRQDTLRGVHSGVADGVLDILVEAFGRINYGRDIHDRKGITDAVHLGPVELGPWEMQRMPLDADFLDGLQFVPLAGTAAPSGPGRRGPAIYRGTLQVTTPGDTHLDMSTWHKGAVWINGHALGRYWDLGPQQTLYLPGCWLHRGANELLVLDVTGDARRLQVSGRTEPILDQLGLDPNAPVAHRKPGQALDLGDRVPAHRGTFTAGREWQEARFAEVTGRYVCLEATSSLAGDVFTTCAELELLGADGRPLPRTGWQVVYADSEELGDVGSLAGSVLDGDDKTFWHTQWQSGAPPHPHQLVLDLGDTQTIAGLRYLPRQDSNNGHIGDYRLLVSAQPFAGL